MGPGPEDAPEDARVADSCRAAGCARFASNTSSSSTTKTSTRFGALFLTARRSSHVAEPAYAQSTRGRFVWPFSGPGTLLSSHLWHIIHSPVSAAERVPYYRTSRANLGRTVSGFAASEVGRPTRLKASAGNESRMNHGSRRA